MEEMTEGKQTYFCPGGPSEILTKPFWRDQSPFIIYTCTHMHAHTHTHCMFRACLLTYTFYSLILIGPPSSIQSQGPLLLSHPE